MHINQILWFINSKDTNILPVKILEKVTKETASGTKTEFVVKTAAGRTFNLSDVKSPYFENLEAVRSHLLEKTMVFIENAITDAAAAATALNDTNGVSLAMNQDTPEISTLPDEENHMVTLPDGKRARVRVRGGQA